MFCVQTFQELTFTALEQCATVLLLSRHDNWLLTICILPLSQLFFSVCVIYVFLLLLSVHILFQNVFLFLDISFYNSVLLHQLFFLILSLIVVSFFCFSIFHLVFAYKFIIKNQWNSKISKYLTPLCPVNPFFRLTLWALYTKKFTLSPQGHLVG